MVVAHNFFKIMYRVFNILVRHLDRIDRFLRVGAVRFDGFFFKCCWGVGIISILNEKRNLLGLNFRRNRLSVRSDDGKFKIRGLVGAIFPAEQEILV